MSAEQNQALVRRYFSDCVSGASGPDRDQALSRLDELLSSDFVMSYSHESPAEAAHGRERHKDFIVGHAETFPDDHWTVEILVADEETAACQWHFQATHAKSGNPVDVRAADFFTVRDGRLTALRRFLDFANLRRQIGARSTEG